MRPLIKIILICICFFGISPVQAQYTSSDFNPTAVVSDGLRAPGRMAVDSNDNIYAADVIQKSIVKYDSQGNYLITITTDFNPISIAINDNDLLFAVDKGTGNIYIVSENGDKTLFYSGTTTPNAMAFGLNILYLTYSKEKKVIGLDISGTIVTDFTYEKFVFITGIAFDPSNNYLLVAEHGGIGEDMEKESGGGCSLCWGSTSYGPQTAVYVFDLEGNHIRTFGVFGNEDGEFQRIQGVDVGMCGNYYAVDPYLGRISVFDNSGNFITKFGLHGNSLGEFNLPMDIVFTSDNRAFVSSMNKGELDVFSINSILPTATITSTNQTVCSLTDAEVEVQLTGTAPWSFTYTVDGLNPQIINTAEITTDPLIKSFNLPVVEVGLYEITAITDSTNTSGTCLTGTAFIQESIPPTATILTSELTKCSTEDSGIEVQFNGLAPFTFTYTIDGLNPTEIITTNNLYILKPEQSGFYEITTLTDAGCSGTEILGNTYVFVNPLPTATVIIETNEIFVDPGEIADVSISFTGNAPYTFTYLKDGVDLISILPTYENPYIFNVFEEGTYKITSVSDANCINNEQQGYFDLVYNDIVLPTANILTESIAICSGETDDISIEFTGTAPWDFTYTINGLNPVEITTTDNPYLLSASLPGVYQLSAVSDINGDGTFSGLATVNQFEQPIVDLGSDINLCEGDPVYVLDAGDFESYLWSDGSTSQTLDISASGIYSVTITNEHGCSASSSVSVNVVSMPLANFYYNASELEVQFVNDSFNAESHYWEFGDGTSSTEENPIHNYASKGTYTVTYTALSDTCENSIFSETINVVGKQNIDVIDIYPNPSTGMFTTIISPNEPIAGNIEVLIVSNSGQTIYSRIIDPNDPNLVTHYNNSYYIDINIVRFTKGVYNVHIMANNFVGVDKLYLKD